MSIHADYTVVYNDHHDPLIAETMQGLTRDVLYDYLSKRPEGLTVKPVTLTKPSEIAEVAKIASELYPIQLLTVPSFLDESSQQQIACSTRPDVEYDDLWLGTRENRLYHSDPEVQRYYYERYAELFNTRRALFGAQLKHIASITFSISY